MKKIMFNDKFSLTKAVLEGRKTQKRVILTSKDEDCDYDIETEYSVWVDDALCYAPMGLGIGVSVQRFEDWCIAKYSRFYQGEEAAIAQCIRDVYAEFDKEHFGKDIMPMLKKFGGQEPSFSNKKFVSAKDMPHRVKIANIRVERLQNISEEDCLKEGVYDFVSAINQVHFYSYDPNGKQYGTAKKAFAVLVDKVLGKGTWERNPWVLVYDFELVK